MLHGIDRDHRDLYICLDIFCQMLLPAFRVAGRFNDRSAGFVGSAADIQTGDPQAFQIPGNVDALLLGQSVRDKLIAVHPDRDRKSGSAGKLDPFDDLRDEPHAVEEIPTVFVGALIGVR